MSQKRHSTRLLLVAITMLLTGSLAGASGLVLCRGADGHRALELDHGATGCPTLASSQDASGVSVQSPGECLDLAAAGAGPIALSSYDAEAGLVPPMAFAAVRPEPAPRLRTRLPASTDARAGPPDLALHLASTVLLV